MATINATAAKLYSNVNDHLYRGRVNLASDTIKVALCNATYTPNQDSHIYKDAAVTAGMEVSGTGYTAGGFTLGTKTITVTSKTTVFDAADVSASGVTVTGIRYLVIYDDTPASNKPLLAYVDLGQAVDVDGALTIQFNAAGIFGNTVA